MKFQKMFTFVLVVLFTISGLAVVFNSAEGLSGELDKKDEESTETFDAFKENELDSAYELTYIRTEPFRIDNNGELAAEASSGSGTENDPYVIENYKIDADGYNYCLYIGNTTDHFVVRNCYLYGCNGSYWSPYFTNSGLHFYNVENGRAEKNIVSHNLFGIRLKFSNGITLKNNTVTSNDNGIYLYDSDSNTLMDNHASSNDCGIYLYDSDSNTLMNNSASSNRFGIELSDSDNNILSENNATLNSLNGIYIVSSQNNTIMNNTVSSNNQGIELGWEANRNTLKNNTVTSNDYGIYLMESRNVTLSENTMEDNGLFIHSWKLKLKHYNTHDIDTSNTVNGKPVYYCKNQDGGTVPYGAGQVILANTTNVTVKDQEFYDYCTVPLLICFSDENIIEGNDAYNNKYGAFLYTSGSNIFRRNTFSDCEYGLFIRNSKDNLIYRNRFINNDIQAQDEKTNNWDGGDPDEGGKGGNYWSDYNGSDRGDGVGDEPYYNITYSSDNPDNYPWVNYHMVPWAESFELDVEDSNSTEPVVKICDAYDMTDELMNGVYTVKFITNGYEMVDNLTFTDGCSEFQISEAVDEGEYVAEATIDGVKGLDTFYVDTGVPTVEVISPTEGADIKMDSVTISWNGDDALSGMDNYMIRLNSGEWMNVGTTQSYTFTGLNESNYEFEVLGYDEVGHTSMDNLTFSVIDDEYLSEDEIKSLMETALEDYLTTGNVSNEITERLEDYMTGDNITGLMDEELQDYMTQENISALIDQEIKDYLTEENVSAMIDGRIQDYLTEEDIQDMIDDGLQSNLSVYMTDEEINSLVNESLDDQEGEFTALLNEELQESLIGYLKEEDLDDYLTKEKVESMQNDQDDDISMSSNIGIVGIVLALIALVIAAWTVMKSGEGREENYDEETYSEPEEQEDDETIEEESGEMGEDLEE